MEGPVRLTEPQETPTSSTEAMSTVKPATTSEIRACIAALQRAFVTGAAQDISKYQEVDFYEIPVPVDPDRVAVMDFTMKHAVMHLTGLEAVTAVLSRGVITITARDGVSALHAGQHTSGKASDLVAVQRAIACGDRMYNRDINTTMVEADLDDSETSFGNLKLFAEEVLGDARHSNFVVSVLNNKLTITFRGKLTRFATPTSAASSAPAAPAAAPAAPAVAEDESECKKRARASAESAFFADAAAAAAAAATLHALHALPASTITTPAPAPAVVAPESAPAAAGADAAAALMSKEGKEELARKFGQCMDALKAMMPDARARDALAQMLRTGIAIGRIAMASELGAEQEEKWWTTLDMQLDVLRHSCGLPATARTRAHDNERVQCLQM